MQAALDAAVTLDTAVARLREALTVLEAADGAAARRP